MSRVKSQNFSILMTDLQGYTDQSSASSREEIVQLIRRHNQLMMPVIQFYGGKIVKSIGDALLCTFNSATDAVVCAIIIQLLLKDYNQRAKDPGRQMNLRVVVNTGDVSLEGGDIYGEAVNVTARMEGLPCFPGGTIGISESTYLLMNRSEIVAEKIGPQMLKGIPDPVTVYFVPIERQKLTALPTKLVQLVEDVAASRDSDGLSTKQLAEWTQALGGFLKEVNWGKKFESLKFNLEAMQKEMVRTFSKESLMESGMARNAPKAPVKKRLISFGIDFAILVVALLVLKTGWWFGERIIFGRPYITGEQYRALDPTESWDSFTEGGDLYYRRPRGLIEKVVDLNIQVPFLLILAYLAISWRIRGATLGQISAGTVVVKKDGTGLDWSTAVLRAAMFLASSLLLGAGAYPLLTEEGEALYDKQCETKVLG